MTDLAHSARRITRILFLAQSLFSAAIIAMATVNSIVGAQLGGSARWAGVPAAVFMLGGAGAAVLWGYLMDVMGRRGGMTLGLALGAAGAGLSMWSLIAGALAPFLVGMLLVGAANAAMLFGRFVSAEVHPPQNRGRAISNVVIGGTVGAIAGPLLVGPTGRLALGAGLDELAGAFGIAALLAAVAAVGVLVGLRPEPLELGRQVAERFPDSSVNSGSDRTVWQIVSQPAAAVAILTMVTGQVVMVAVMVITSLHMRSHDHGLGSISAVISSHTLGMYAFSILSGRLADRWGRGPVIMFGAGTLLLACLAASLSPAVLPLAIALFLLGLGWNFCFVGGSTLLADQLSPAERARTQGFNDLLVGLAAATASVGSGIVFAAVGFNVMAYLGAALSLLPLVAVVSWRRWQTPGTRVVGS